MKTELQTVLRTMLKGLKKVILVKRVISIILMPLFVFMAPCAYADTVSTQSVDFPQAVQMALTANPRMTVSQADIEAAQAGITKAKAAEMPALNFESNAARSNNPLDVFSYKLAQGQVTFADFGAAQFADPTTLNATPTALDNPSYYSNFNNGIVLNVPIFSGGANQAQLKKTQALLKAAQEGNHEARLELTFDVLQAYEGARTTATLVNIAKQSAQAMKSYTQMTQSLYQQTRVLKSDVLLSQSSYQQAQTILENTLAQHNNQLDTFRILLGRPQSHLNPGSAVYLPLPQQSLSTLQSSALLSNSQLAALKAQADAEESDLRVAKAGYWPELNLQLRHDWNSPDFNLSAPSNTVMLELNWSLFNFGMQSGSSREAKAQYQKALANWQNAGNNLRLSVLETARAIQTDTTRIQTSDLTAKELSEMVSMLKEKYGQVATPLSVLLDAQTRLDTARAQQVMARYDLLMAQAKLLMLLNQLSPAIQDKIQ